MRRLITVLFLTTAFSFAGCHHPADVTMRKRFFEKRAVFEELALKIEATSTVGLVSQDEQKTTLRTGLSAFALGEFTCAKREDGTVLFIYSSTGLAISGTRKGIAYVPKKSLRFYQVLPASDDDWPRRDEFLKHLDGDWYLFVIN